MQQQRGESGPVLARRGLLRAGAGLGAALAVATSPVLAGPAAAAVPAARRGGVIDARALGARGDGRTDDTRALQAALDDGRSTVVVGRGTYRVSGTLDVPAHVQRLVVGDGAVLQQTVDADLLNRAGEVDPVGLAARPAARGDQVIRLQSAAHGLRAGSWVYYHSDRYFVQQRYRPGGLRRVVRVDGPELVLDRPVPRDAPGTVRVHPVRLAPPLRLEGPGALEHVNPPSTRRNLLRMTFCASPAVAGLEVRQGGASGVVLWSTVGGFVDVDVHDLLDDPRGGHYGYGVEVRAGTRDLQVRGSASRVRHAFTTNGGWTSPVPALLKSGEPEDVHVRLRVRDTSSTGLDTHEAGHRITLVPDVASTGRREFGGVMVRCHDVVVHGGAVRDAGSFGVRVDAGVTGTVVRHTQFDDSARGWALDLHGDARLDNVKVRHSSGGGVFVSEGVRVDATRLLVDGRGSARYGVASRRGAGALQGEVRGCQTGVNWDGGRGPDTSRVWVRDCARASRGGAPFSRTPTRPPG